MPRATIARTLRAAVALLGAAVWVTPAASSEDVLARFVTARFVTAACDSDTASVGCTAGIAFEGDVAGALSSEQGRAETRLGTRLGVAELDQIAAQWTDPASPVGSALRKGAKVTALPGAGEIWTTGTAPSGEKLTVSLVNPTWTGKRGSKALFPEVKSLLPDGQAMPPTVLVRGRFAARLAASGHPVDADILGGDSASGRAFYEQLLPMSATAASLGFPLVALTDFSRGDGQLPCPPTASGTAAECFTAAAHLHAEALFEVAETNALRFGAPATLPVHIRVLAATNAMAAPPGRWPALPPLRVTGLLAASQGQLDPPDLSAPVAVTLASSLDYSALPGQVAWDALLEVDADPVRQPFAREALAEAQPGLYSDLTTSTAPLPVPWEREKWAAWADENASPGRVVALQAVLAWRALQAIECAAAAAKERCGPSEAGARLTWERTLLRRQLRYQLASTLDPGTPDKPAATAPKDHVKAALREWKGVLEASGLAADLAPQAGPLGVDPTAVCTVGDGPAAQAELVEKAIDVDLAFVLPATDDPPTPGEVLPSEVGEALLWQARDQLPFVALDDPKVTRPEVVLDGALTSGALLYRARWRVWSGWHLLWGVGSEGAGISLRLAAACDDLGMAPGGLLPSLVSAALDGADPAGWGSTIRARIAASGPPTVVLVSRSLVAPLSPHRPSPPPGVQLEEAVPLDGAAAGRRLLGEGRAILLDPDGGSPTPLAPDVVQTSFPEVADASAAVASGLGVPSGITRPAMRTGARFQVGVGAMGALGAAGMPIAAVADVRTAASSRIAIVPGLSWSVGAGALVGSPPAPTAWAAPATGSSVSPFVGGLTSAGVAWEPLPAVERARRAEVAWGATTPSGSPSVPRVQAGLDLVAVLGADTSGDVRGGVFGEPWVAWSIATDEGRAAFLRPYAPGMLIGPSVRVGYELTARSVWAGLGLRVQAPPPAKKP